MSFNVNVKHKLLLGYLWLPIYSMGNLLLGTCCYVINSSTDAIYLIMMILIIPFAVAMHSYIILNTDRLSSFNRYWRK